MSFEQHYILDKINFHQSNHTKVQVNHPKPDLGTVPDAVIAFVPLGFVIIWTGLFLMISKMRTMTIDKIIITANPLKKVPCNNCQFFSSNAFLKCAVQPSIVLTEEANNCSDYCPKNSTSC
ncbi:MAG: hypothetical protein PUP91_33760 [Rhizonema sp. PD37]|nr:hypothetical protein [Rhizonema sp. PD37]